MQHQKYCLFVLFFISLSGCSSIGFREKNKFEARIQAFAHSLRWSQFEEAQSFIRLRNKQSPDQNIEYLKQIKITKYEPLSEIARNVPNQESSEITSTYTIDYYHMDNYIIKHHKYEQAWWYDDTVGTWFLDSELPKFK